MDGRSTAAAALTIGISEKPPQKQQLLSHIRSVSIRLVGADAEKETGRQTMKEQKQKHRISMGDGEVHHFCQRWTLKMKI